MTTEPTKKKTGRPLLPDEKRKQYVCRVRLTTAEAETLSQYGIKHGQTITQVIRHGIEKALQRDTVPW